MNYHYTIFKTRCGYFGLFSTKNGLFRTCLPTASREITKKHLTKGLINATYQKDLLPALQQKVIDYYKGTCVDFADTIVDLSGLTPISQKILRACMQIKYGKTITYKQLAAAAARPNAARAAGAVMARNRLPLIIPCHRVIAADGSLGGFSAQGGLKTKRQMLELERCNLLK